MLETKNNIVVIALNFLLVSLFATSGLYVYSVNSGSGVIFNLYIFLVLCLLILGTFFARKNFLPFSKESREVLKGGKLFVVSLILFLLIVLLTWFIVASIDPNAGGEGDPLVLALFIPMILSPFFIAFYISGLLYSIVIARKFRRQNKI